ncbi:hypothetical protein D9M71_565320 [compost metagenome]
MQARRRQARVQRQVAGAGLEAADNHAQQRQPTLGKQCHWLVHADAGSHQRMAQAVGRQVQPGVIIGCLQAAGHGTLWMRHDLRFELRDEALFQRINPLGPVAVLQQEALLLGAQQR